MTEQEWLECQDIKQLLEYMVVRSSSRKFRLYGCACCRRIWHLLPDEQSKNAILVAEQHADGLATDDELDVAQRTIVELRNQTLFRPRESRAPDSCAYTSVLTVLRHTPYYNADACSQLAYAASWTTAGDSEEERHHQLLMFRDIFENPYRPGWIEPEWLTWHDGTVVKLAQSIYDNRAFDHLPILADALEEAGCSNAGILNHCRQPGEHVRGCWVVDLALGKE